jgi:hypothetical protein
MHSSSEKNRWLRGNKFMYIHQYQLAILEDESRFPAFLILAHHLPFGGRFKCKLSMSTTCFDTRTDLVVVI